MSTPGITPKIKPSPSIPYNTDDLIQKYSSQYQVDPQLIKLIVGQESGGNNSAKSRVGAQGLMQIMPDTARLLKIDPTNPEQNIEGGIRHFKGLLTKYGGDTSKALAAYNAGSGAVDQYGGVPPFNETQNYVKSIMRRYSPNKTSNPQPQKPLTLAAPLENKIGNSILASPPSIAMPPALVNAIGNQEIPSPGPLAKKSFPQIPISNEVVSPRQKPINRNFSSLSLPFNSDISAPEKEASMPPLGKKQTLTPEEIRLGESVSPDDPSYIAPVRNMASFQSKPSVLPEALAHLAALNTPEREVPIPPPEVVAGQPNVSAPPPDSDHPLSGFDAIQRLIAGPGEPGAQEKPTLAPHKKSFGEKLNSVLPYIAAAGGAMEGAGNGPFHPPVGAEMYQQAALQGRQLEATKAAKAAELKIEQQKADAMRLEAEGKSVYYNSLNPTKLGVAGIGAQAKENVAQTNKRFQSVPNVGLIDTQAQGGPSLVPGSNPTSVTVTPEIATDYNMPQQLVGKTVPLQQFALMERGGAMQNTAVMGAQGPALLNKNTGKVTLPSKPLGNPGVASAYAGASARAANTPTNVYDENGNLTAISQQEQLRSGRPSANATLASGKAVEKAYEPALDSDTRLKQMYEQATDKTGASDMALLFNHIAMTGGNVKGLRMGAYLTDEHRTARGIPEELGVLWNHLASGQSLSPQQRVNFVRLGEQVRQTRWDQANRSASLQGASGSAPAPDPDLPTVKTIQNAPVQRQNSGTPSPRTQQGGGGQPAPEGYIHTLGDGSKQIKRGGKWVPYTGK